MTTPSLPSLERLLDAARMRIMASRAAPRALGTIAVLSLAAACAVPPMRWLGLGHPWWVVVLPAIGGVMALSAAWRARPDRRRAATAVDTSHGFHDALATALSAEHSRHADPVFVELQRRSLESLLPRADLRRLDSPLPRPIALAGCAAALALLGAVLLIDWPLPRPSVRGADATVAETDAANAALADAQAAESEARELAELAQRIQLLADEGRLGDAERAFEELEAKSRALSRRLRSTEAEGADSPEADATRTALLESASRIGDASQSIGERTRPQEGDRDARASAEPRDQLDAPARVEAERTLPPAPGTTDSVHQPAPRERETMPPLPESSGTNDTVSRPTESSRSNETKARERESLPREGGTEKSDSRDARTSDATAREGATGDTATRDSATRDAAARDSATRDSATRDSATRDSATRDSATRDAAARDSATGDRRAQDPLAPGSQSRPSPGTKPPSQQPPGTESRSDQE
ncbi:MAG: hypothetical protein FJ253_12655, partial [Phycisphaerae bacterium]|nr:hypothetical protein [Phycisphaerae bacterium]